MRLILFTFACAGAAGLAAAAAEMPGNTANPAAVGDAEAPRVLEHVLVYIVNGKRDAMVFLTASKSNGREGRPLRVQTKDGGKSCGSSPGSGRSPTEGSSRCTTSPIRRTPNG